MSARPRLAELLEAERAEAEREERLAVYRQGLERDLALLDERLVELGAEPQQPPRGLDRDSMRRTAVEARREEEAAQAANAAAHANPDPPVYDPLAELLMQKRGRRRQFVAPGHRVRAPRTRVASTVRRPSGRTGLASRRRSV